MLAEHALLAKYGGTCPTGGTCPEQTEQNPEQPYQHPPDPLRILRSTRGHSFPTLHTYLLQDRYLSEQLLSSHCCESVNHVWLPVGSGEFSHSLCATAFVTFESHVKR